MKLIIQGTNITITDSINDYVTQKIHKAVKHFEHFMTKIDIKLSVPPNTKKNPLQVAEVTLFANGTIIRAQEKHENLYASIDLVADKLTRQLQKYKDKKQRKPQPNAADGAMDEQQPTSELLQEGLSAFGDRTPELPPKVVRNKFFAMPPMSIHEAEENLELVDHDFYVFQNAETGEINVIYERNHGGYGVIQPRQS